MPNVTEEVDEMLSMQRVSQDALFEGMKIIVCVARIARICIVGDLLEGVICQEILKLVQDIFGHLLMSYTAVHSGSQQFKHTVFAVTAPERFQLS